MITCGKSRFKIVFVVLAALGLLTLYFLSFRAEVRIETDIEDSVQVYWSGDLASYSEKNSSIGEKDHTTYLFTIGNLFLLNELRIDPLREKGPFNIYSVQISQPGYKTITFSSQEELSRFVPANQLVDFHIQEGKLSGVSSGTDPQIKCPVETSLSFIWFAGRFIASLIFVSILFCGCKIIFQKYKSIGVAGVGIANLVLVGLLIINWWSYKDNNLFQNGNWIAGKDTGKFVFQTYDFLSEPITDKGISLSDNMGFQEILYVKGNNTSRRLVELSGKVYIGPKAYIWFELDKKDGRMLGVRISRNNDYKSGFYTYTPDGELIEKHLVALPEILLHSWSRISVARDKGNWILTVNGQQVGHFPHSSTEDGTFGFRGCASGRILNLKDISMKFIHPVTGKTWIESEDFSPLTIQKRIAPWVLCFLAIVLLVKFVRDELLADFLPAVKQQHFRLSSQLALLFPACIAWLFLPKEYIYTVPLCFLVAELVSVISFALFYKHNPAVLPRKWCPVLYVVFLVLISGSVLIMNGRFMAPSQNIAKKSLNHIHPDIFIITPQGPVSTEFNSKNDRIIIAPGQPFFVPGLYKEQIIASDFLLPENVTLDIVFEQQGFLTHGDPEGEAIPLQRRLLRLSTQPGVVSGLSSKTGVRPAPFLKLNGELTVGGENHVSISVNDNRIKVELNGATTNFNQFRLLGIGQTGFMTYGKTVTLNRVSVKPLEAGYVSGNLIQPLILLAPFVFALLVYFLFRLAGAVPILSTIIIALCAYFPVALFLAANIFLSPGDLRLLGDGRLGWIFIMLTALAVNLFYAMVINSRMIRFKPLVANCLSVLVVMAFAGYIYILLPNDHSLKLKFSQTAIAPGDIAHNKEKIRVPWYADNGLINTNIWAWNQRFGGESIAPGKNKDKVRIFVIGGSQAWGSGAADSNSTFTKLLEKNLLARELPVQILNGGINSAGLHVITRANKELLPVFKPDIVIIDVGTNDSGAIRMIADREKRQTHLSNLLKIFSSFIHHFQEQDVYVILNLEAMCAETYDMFYPEMELYDGLKEIAETNGVPVIIPSKVTEQLEKDHLLWWDIAHFTPFGQKVMAGLLEVETEKLVKKILKKESLLN
jgi:hypothetical protein